MLLYISQYVINTIWRRHRLCSCGLRVRTRDVGRVGIDKERRPGTRVLSRSDLTKQNGDVKTPQFPIIQGPTCTISFSPRAAVGGCRCDVSSHLVCMFQLRRSTYKYTRLLTVVEVKHESHCNFVTRAPAPPYRSTEQTETQNVRCPTKMIDSVPTHKRTHCEKLRHKL